MSIPRVPNFATPDFPRRVADVTSRLLKITDGTALKINGVQVVGEQGDAIADLTVTATSGTLPTANGSVTIANAATPTVAELLEYCRELEAKIEALLAAQRTHGLIAT